ncbi:MAG: GH3 auxin-responsive promoter family protein [Leptospirales bacterium]|nr:GH3 auxin-responsive promoter family protein [Leptospirales bacterium]
MYRWTGWVAELLLKLLSRKAPLSFEQSCRSQSKILQDLVHRAAATRFGIDHDFKSIRTIEEYQQQVRLRSYADFWSEYWEKAFPRLVNNTWPGRIPYFARTSGTTTGKSKYIPCTLEMVRSNNRAGLVVMLEHLRNRPRSKVLRGRYFMFAGSPNLEQLSADVFAGELSGIAARETPSWAGKDRNYPPPELARITDWNEKLDAVSADCLNKNIRAISGLPSWLQILFLRIFKDKPVANAGLASYFPDLELIVHGGMSLEPYRQYFQQIAAGMNLDYREIYAASEGFFAIADRAHGEGLRLIPDNGIFYEFVRLEDFHSLNPKRNWIENIENDVDYVLVVSTCAGLWSYVVGDIVRFVDRKNLRLLFSGRLSQTLSMFGEKVLNEEVELALSKALKALNATLKDFAIHSAFTKEDRAKGIHTYIIELAEEAAGIEQKLARMIDQNLIDSNSGYATRRKSDINIVEPRVILGRKGLFESWMNSMGKTGGQHKVPRLINDAQMTDLLARNQAQ